MSRCCSEKTIMTNYSNPKQSSDLTEYQQEELRDITKTFISSVFECAKKKTINIYQQEKEIVANFISSMFKEEENKLAVSLFMDSLFQDVKRKVYGPNMKENENNNSISVIQNSLLKKDLNAKRKGILINDKNSIYNGLSGCKSKCDENNCDYNSSKKFRKVHFSCDKENISNMTTFYKDSKTCKSLCDDSSLKEKRNCDTKEKDKKITKLNFHKSELSVDYRAKVQSDKERKKYEENVKIMKRHISAIKRRQEEMKNKISILKQRENRIKKIKEEKVLFKNVLVNNIEMKRATLMKKRQNIEKQKEIIYNGMEKSSKNLRLEKMEKYKQAKGERIIFNSLKRLDRLKDNKNAKMAIKKIKTLREYNKNIIHEKKKILNKNNDVINRLQYENNIKKVGILKTQLKELKTEENESRNELIRTKEKFMTFIHKDNKFKSKGKSCIIKV